MIYEYFRVIGASQIVLDFTDLSSPTSHVDDIQDSDTSWDQALPPTGEVHHDAILESLYVMRIQGSDQLQTVLAMYEQEINQNPSKPSYQKLKTMVKRQTDQKIRTSNFQARNERLEDSSIG